MVGQVRYVGPICNAEYVAKLEGASHDTFIGLELPSNGGDTDGTVEGKRFFYWFVERAVPDGGLLNFRLLPIAASRITGFSCRFQRSSWLGHPK